MRTVKTSRVEAVVLKAIDYGETDKILTLFTPNLGKVRAVAKGVRRATSHMGGHLDLFAHSTVLLVHGRNMEIATQAQGRHVFAGLRGDLVRLAQACYAVELTDRLTADHNPSPELFRALVTALHRIEAGDAADTSLLLYQLQLLALAGYRPQFHRCVTCDTVIQPGANLFDAPLGGVLCATCGRSQPLALPITSDALKVLRNLQTRSEVMLAVTVPASVLQEVESTLARYTSYLLERRPRSAAFLDTLRRVDSA